MTAQPCVTAPEGERCDAQMRQLDVRPKRVSEWMAVSGRRGQHTFYRMLAEAVQNEAWQLVPEHVNQDVSGTHLPATAWPRQVCPPRAVWGRVWSGGVRARVGTC